MFAIQTSNLTKIYKTKKVVDGIDLNIREGSVFGFLGPNGAGKTTTIRMLLGLVKPSTGNAEIFGYNVQNEYHKASKYIAAIVENPSFFPYLNAIQTLQTFADYCHLDKSQSELESILERCGILYASKQRVDTFSLGMKQRLGIAVTLINNPKIIFLDEPANGLDPEGIIKTRELIRQLANEEKRTVFISSHLLNEIEQICDEIAILHKGKIKVSGIIDNLLQSKGAMIKVFPKPLALKVLTESFPEIRIKENGLSEKILLDVEFEMIPRIIEKLVNAKIEIYEVVRTSQTLEELFHQITVPE